MSIRYPDSFETSGNQVMDVTPPHFDNPFQFTLPRLATTTIVDSSELYDSPVGLTRNATFSSVSPVSRHGSGDYFSHNVYSDSSLCGPFSDDGEYSPPEKKQWLSLMQVVADSKYWHSDKGKCEIGQKGQ